MMTNNNWILSIPIKEISQEFNRSFYWDIRIDKILYISSYNNFL